MRLLLRAVVGILVLVVIAIVVVAFSLDHIVKSTVESEATKSLGLKTTLDGAHVSLTGGTVELRGLRIASPPGFSTPTMLEVGRIGVAIRYSELRANPHHVESIAIDAPKLTVEQSGGALNFRKAEQLMPKSKPSENPMKLVIDRLDLRDGQVIVRPGLPGLQQQVTVAVPSLAMKDIGRGKGAQNGAAIRDVALQVISALAEHAAQSGNLPAELKGLLHLNVNATAAALGSEALKHVGEAVPGQLGKSIPGNVGNQLLQQFTGSGSAQPSGRAPATAPRH
jgi:uncharacterized protein involved in outer membrane biogenesis